jgi:hypothetical protein
VSKPDWLRIENERATDLGKRFDLVGTPTDHAVKELSQVVIIVTDNAGVEASESFTIQVNNVNDVPVITSTERPSSEVNEWRVYPSYTLVVTDEDSIHTETLRYELRYAPEWLTVNVETGELSGTPSSSDIRKNGDIELIVRDRQGATDRIVFDVEVKDVNDRPTVEDLGLSMREDGEMIITRNEIEALYVDVDAGDVLVSVRMVNLPEQGILKNNKVAVEENDVIDLNNLGLSYRSQENMSGLISFGIQLSDGSLESEVGTISITVIEENDAPEISADIEYEGYEDMSQSILSQDLLEVYSDVELSELVSINIVSISHEGDLSGGLLNGETDVSVGDEIGFEGLNLSYEPNADLSGTMKIGYRVSDGDLYSEVGFIEIEVEAVNDAPSISPHQTLGTQSSSSLTSLHLAHNSN